MNSASHPNPLFYLKSARKVGHGKSVLAFYCYGSARRPIRLSVVAKDMCLLPMSEWIMFGHKLETWRRQVFVEGLCGRQNDFRVSKIGLLWCGWKWMSCFVRKCVLEAWALFCGDLRGISLEYSHKFICLVRWLSIGGKWLEKLEVVLSAFLKTRLLFSYQNLQGNIYLISSSASPIQSTWVGS